MPKSTSESAASYANITSSSLVTRGPGKLLGVFVAIATATPTLKIWDQTSAATPVLVNTFTPVAGTFYRIPARYKNGLFATISGTVDCTFFYENN